MALLLSLLFVQGIPVTAADSGKIAGVLRNAAGRPLPGVRVGALTQPEAGQNAGLATALVSLAETDEAGRYILESIPPGRYYITAGRVDFPTYYPGTQDMAAGTLVQITPGAAVSGIDFVMRETSVRPPPTFNTAPLAISDLIVTLSINVEGGGK